MTAINLIFILESYKTFFMSFQSYFPSSETEFLSFILSIFFFARFVSQTGASRARYSHETVLLVLRKSDATVNLCA